MPASIFVAINIAPAVRPGFSDMLNRRHRWVTVYGRLKPGVSIQQAQAGRFGGSPSTRYRCLHWAKTLVLQTRGTN
jgi:hypothetical protein